LTFFSTLLNNISTSEELRSKATFYLDVILLSDLKPGKLSITPYYLVRVSVVTLGHKIVVIGVSVVSGDLHSINNPKLVELLIPIIKNKSLKSRRTSCEDFYQSVQDKAFIIDDNKVKSSEEKEKILTLGQFHEIKENFVTLVSNAKESLSSDLKKFLDLLLAQNEIIGKNIGKNQETVTFAQGQLNAYKIILQDKLQHDELEILLNEQKKILRLENRLCFLQSYE
ncbi:14888_t:CDS:2, partial [Funneliformis geosporum]